MLRFVGILPGFLVLVLAGCDSGGELTACREDVEPREACLSFDATTRRCEPFLPIDITPRNLGELCECLLVACTDDFPDCEAAWEAEHACLGALDECEDYVAHVLGDEDAPCRDEVEATNQVCFDENGLQLCTN